MKLVTVTVTLALTLASTLPVSATLAQTWTVHNHQLTEDGCIVRFKVAAQEDDYPYKIVLHPDAEALCKFLNNGECVTTSGAGVVLVSFYGTLVTAAVIEDWAPADPSLCD